MKSTIGAIMLFGVSTSLLLMPGCSGTSHKAITRKLTPELRGLSMRPVDAHNATAITNNQNWRMFSDDLARTFYTDHPTRLSPYPITYTSGQPR